MNGEYKARTDLVEKETSKTRGNDGVADQQVPVGPLPLDPAERGKVGASVELLCGMLVEDGGGGSRVEGHDRVGKGGRGGGSANGSPSFTLTAPSKIGPLYSSHDRYVSRSALVNIRTGKGTSSV